MVKTKHQSPTEFAYPVERICGKISRHSKVVHACTASGKKITYLQGERNLVTHPESADELAARDLFKRRQAAVAVRVAKTSPTYADDLAAYRTQLEGDSPIEGFSKYIWSLVKAEITE